MSNNIKIGLEIHLHLNTSKKLFCNCSIPKKHDDINTSICPICTGQPGSKPQLPNKEALKQILKLAIVCNSKITKKTNFQRKHYSWPDMPTGFQRTVSGANIKETSIGGSFEGVELTEIHLEEDPAGWDPQTGEINYNRSGFPLAEFVTEPVFNSTEKLKKWLEELILVAKYLGILNVEYGIKSDVNVSIEESGFSRVEIKNVGSISGIVRAAEVEIERQRELVKNGKKIPQETRRFDENLEETQFMRSKENAQDYMFTPEPDLPNLIVEDELIEELKKTIPQMPKVKREKYSKFGFDKETIEVIVSNLYLTEIFEHALNTSRFQSAQKSNGMISEDAIKKKINPKEVGLFLRREILRVLNYNKETFEDLEKKDIKQEITNLIELLGEDKISYTTAQKILEKLYDGSWMNELPNGEKRSDCKKFDVEKYVKENNLMQVQDTGLIEELVKKALSEAPKAVEDYKNGNTKSLNFIVGIVMRETKGTAKPQIVNKVMLEEVKKL